VEYDQGSGFTKATDVGQSRIKEEEKRPSQRKMRTKKKGKMTAWMMRRCVLKGGGALEYEKAFADPNSDLRGLDLRKHLPA